MVRNPCIDPLKHAGRDPAFHGRFSTLFAQLPGGVAANNAAGDGACSQEPGIAAMRDKQEQEQVCASGNGQRNDGGVDDCDSKHAERAQMNKPMGKQRVVRAGGGGWGKNDHFKV